MEENKDLKQDQKENHTNTENKQVTPKLEGHTLAIVAIVFAFLIPLVSFICAGVGLSKSSKQLAENPNLPKTAQTLCWVALTLALAMTFFNVLINLSTATMPY